MFIVKKRSEIIRFGLFVALAALMAWFVLTRNALFRTSQAPTPKTGTAVQQTAAGAGKGATAKPGTAAGQGAQVVTGKQAQTAAGKPAPASAGVGTGASYLAEYRIEREQQRAARQEQLMAMINNPNVAEEARRAASDQLMQVQKQSAMEAMAEMSLKADGFPDVLVVLSDQTAEVRIRGVAGLTAQQQMQIVDTVSSVTGVKSAYVRVKEL
jgi:stage III sporulation protein AH